MARDKKPGFVKSALLNWLGVPITLLNGAFWQEWYGQSSTGKVVSVEKSLQLSAVWACVRLLSETISTLPLKIYEKTDDGYRKPAVGHPLYEVLKRPNAEMTQARFLLMVMASICLRGNAFIEIKTIGERIIALVPLLPQNMAVKRTDTGRIKYEYTENGKNREIPENRMLHIRGFGIDGLCGIQPIKASRDVLGSAMSADEAAAKVFSNGLQASGVLSTETDLKEPQREALRKSLQKFSGSTNAGKLLVLENGMKYQGITMNPEAAQMLETRSYSVEEICRYWGVPPFMIGHMDKQSSWASSVEGMNLQWLTNNLRPRLVNLEQEFDRCLLGRDDRYFFHFSVEALLRADSAGRSAFYHNALNDGWMCRNDVRKKEDLSPIEGGDIFTVQSNMIPIDQLGQQPGAQESARAAMRAWLFPEEQNRSD